MAWDDISIMTHCGDGDKAEASGLEATQGLGGGVSTPVQGHGGKELGSHLQSASECYDFPGWQGLTSQMCPAQPVNGPQVPTFSNPI